MNAIFDGVATVIVTAFGIGLQVLAVGAALLVILMVVLGEK